MNPRFSRSLLVLFGISCSAPAWASLTFPAQVQSYYGIDTLPASPPGCTLCHRDDAGGPQTVVTPFGRALLARGAAATSLPNLVAALTANEGDGTDSDGDGASDAEELRTGENPNVGNGMGSAQEVLPLPETGCGVRAASGTSSPGYAAIAVAALLLALRLPRRR